MFKINNTDTRTMSDVFVINFEKIFHIVLGFLLLTLNKYMPAEIKLLNVKFSEI